MKWLMPFLLLFISHPAFAVRVDSDKANIHLNTEKVAHIIDEVNLLSELQFTMEIMATSKMDGDRIILINSPGGSVEAGNHMIDLMVQEQQHGTKMICVVLGDASSMAFNILSQCDVRLAVPNARMIVHKIEMAAFPGDERMTATNLRKWARYLDNLETPFRYKNATAMHLSFEDYDKWADRQKNWSSKELLERGYLNDILDLKYAH